MARWAQEGGGGAGVDSTIRSIVADLNQRRRQQLLQQTVADLLFLFLRSSPLSRSSVLLFPTHLARRHVRPREASPPAKRG